MHKRDLILIVLVLVGLVIAGGVFGMDKGEPKAKVTMVDGVIYPESTVPPEKPSVTARGKQIDEVWKTISGRLEGLSDSAKNYIWDPPNNAWVDFNVVYGGDADLKEYVSINGIPGVNCAAENCVLKKEAKEALVQAGQNAQSKGYTLIVTSAFRTELQQADLYIENLQREESEEVPVCGPKSGSYEHCKHVQGIAVDLYIKELGVKPLEKKPHAYDSSIEYHKELRDIMANAGFNGISSEWWHFEYRK